jgi:hypothetical protein
MVIRSLQSFRVSVSAVAIIAPKSILGFFHGPIA